MKEIKLYIRASYIVFFFVKKKNDNLIKEIKHVLREFIAWRKPEKVCENFRAGKNPQLRLGFPLISS